MSSYCVSSKSRLWIFMCGGGGWHWSLSGVRITHVLQLIVSPWENNNIVCEQLYVISISSY